MLVHSAHTQHIMHNFYWGSYKKANARYCDMRKMYVNRKAQMNEKNLGYYINYNKNMLDALHTHIIGMVLYFGVQI